MVFQKGRRYESQYHTPYGTLDMALYCTRASFAQDLEGGELALQYQLDVSGQYAAMHGGISRGAACDTGQPAQRRMQNLRLWSVMERGARFGGQPV